MYPRGLVSVSTGGFCRQIWWWWWFGIEEKVTQNDIVVSNPFPTVYVRIVDPQLSRILLYLSPVPLLTDSGLAK